MDRKKVEAVYSQYNACQALMLPSGHKSKVLKALTKTMIVLLGVSVTHADEATVKKHLATIQSMDVSTYEAILQENGMIKLKQKYLPPDVAKSCRAVTIEDAGVIC